MEMSFAYVETVAHDLARGGFPHRRDDAVLGTVEGGPCRSSRFVLERGPEERLALEVVVHPTAGESYFLELEEFHGLRSFGFPLDSWKLHADRLELKYYALPDSGRGLSITLRLPPRPSSS